MLYKAFLRIISNILLIQMHLFDISSSIVLIKYEHLGKVLLFSCVLDTFCSTVIQEEDKLS